jgi:hypothetical protein
MTAFKEIADKIFKADGLEDEVMKENLSDLYLPESGESALDSKKSISGPGRPKGAKTKTVRPKDQVEILSKWALSDIISTPFGKALHKMNKWSAA